MPAGHRVELPIVRLELKIPPVGVWLAVAGLMWLASRFAPLARFAFPGSGVTALLFVAAGLLFAVPGVAAFVRARTTLHPMRPEGATRLVTSGVYRASRNPMYLGLLLLLGAWAVHLGAVSAIAGLPAFMADMTRFQIVPEERALTARFGEDFAAYCASVRRWL